MKGLDVIGHPFFSSSPLPTKTVLNGPVNAVAQPAQLTNSLEQCKASAKEGACLSYLCSSSPAPLIVWSHANHALQQLNHINYIYTIYSRPSHTCSSLASAMYSLPWASSVTKARAASLRSSWRTCSQECGMSNHARQNPSQQKACGKSCATEGTSLG